MYVTIQGFGNPQGTSMQYASQAVWLPNGKILGPKAIAEVVEIPSGLRHVLRQVSDDELSEYLDAGHTVLDAIGGD
jgi:hypothetical protein